MKNYFCKILWVFMLTLIPSFVFAQSNQVKVFLGNGKMNPGSADCSKVFAVTRNVPKTKAPAKAALLELFKGVTGDEKTQGYESLFSADSASILKKVKIIKGAAYVNFTPEIREKVSSASSSCGRDMFFAQVEKTLKQFSSVKKVFFAIDGEPSEFYKSWLELNSCPKELGNCSTKNFR